MSIDDAAALLDDADVSALRFEEGGMAGEYYLKTGDTTAASIEEFKSLTQANYGLEPAVTALQLTQPDAEAERELTDQAATMTVESTTDAAPRIPTAEPSEAETTALEPQARAADVPDNFQPSRVISRATESGNGTVSFNQQYFWNDTTNRSRNLDINWGIELEFSLVNEAIPDVSRPNCPSGTDNNFWAGRGVAGRNEVILWSAASATRSDTGIEAYYDGFDASDPCSRNGFDIGIGYPQRITPTPSFVAELATLIVTEKGTQQSSRFSARYQAVLDECFGTTRSSRCMNLNLPGSANFPGPGVGNGPFFGLQNLKHVPGGFTYNEGTPEYLAICTVGGAFGTRYGMINGGNGPLGRCDGPEHIRFPRAPFTDRVQDFLNGKMYQKVSAGIGPWEVYGEIYKKYEVGLRLPGATGIMGFPTSGELGTPNGQGRFNRFETGNIYFGFPVGRAHAVNGAIFVRYGQEGYEGGRFGFPTSDEFDIPGGKQTNFQGGWIRWDSATNRTSTS